MHNEPKEFSSFSLVDYIGKFKGADKRFCGAALFLVMWFLLPPTLFLSNFDRDPYVSRIEAQIAQGDLVRKSGLLPAFTRVSYVDPDPVKGFEHYCQLQCGLAPIVLLHDQRHEYLLLNSPQSPVSLPEGYRVMRDFGHGLLLLKRSIDL